MAALRAEAAISRAWAARARYTLPAIAFELALKGDAKMLSYKWLRRLAKAGKPLPRRQELPREAFADIKALKKAHAKLAKKNPHIAAEVLPFLSIS